MNDAPASALDVTAFWGVAPQPARPGVWSAALWAPAAEEIAFVLNGQRQPMQKGGDGCHRLDFTAEPGAYYGFDAGHGLRPDPAARAQVGDVHGPSRLMDPDAFLWPRTEDSWRGRRWAEAVILEIHIGLFTPEGDFAAAAAKLPEIAAQGFTAIEIMPIAQFSGQRGWGYDGVLPSAPHVAYGSPEDFKALIATAHALGLSVILDVVYNHFGPDGAYLHELAPSFFDTDRATPWGAAINYALPAVRDYFLSNVRMWIAEFHIDGLRIDAAHQIKDSATPSMLEEIAATARAAGEGREIWLILEDERNLAGLTAPEAGFDAQWNDDYHHALHCLLTGENESYYSPFAADPMADLVKALSEGQVDQGQPRPATQTPRGEASGHLPPTAFVVSNQTHDQVGNRARGERLIALTSPQAAKAAHAMLLALPFVPMLFMGEEVGETAPFCFFADFPEPMAEATRKGRQKEFERFASFSGQVPDPIAVETFEMSRPYRGPAQDQAEWQALTTRLLTFRAERIVPLIIAAGPTGIAEMAEVEVLGPRALHARWRLGGGVLQIAANFADTPMPHPVPFAADLTVGDWSNTGCSVLIAVTKDV